MQRSNRILGELLVLSQRCFSFTMPKLSLIGREIGPCESDDLGYGLAVGLDFGGDVFGI